MLNKEAVFLRLKLLVPLWLIISICFDGCFSPTIPLPPPVVDDINAPDSKGLVSVAGSALENNYISCLNERSEKGVIVMSDQNGRFSLQIVAEVGDNLTLWQSDGVKRGQAAQEKVPEE